jgi:D-inositol-3-phosphate glycosyltransferase
MQIALVTNYLPPYEGGIQFVVDELANRYVARGHSVSVLGFDATPDRASGPSYRRVGIPGWNPLERRSVPVPLFEPVSLARALRNAVSEADAFHLHGSMFPANAVASVLASRRGLPVVVTEHVGLVSYGRPALDALQVLALHTVGRTCLRHASAVTALNQRVMSELAPFVTDGTPLHRVPNGVDTAAFSPCNATERARLRAKWGFTLPTTIFVGRRTQKKRLDLLIEAARRQEGWGLVICGKDTQELVVTDDMPSSVRTLGLLGRSDLIEIYRAADLLALVSEGEGFPLVVQEALACGLPVVVTANETNREYLNEDVAAFVPQDAQCIERAVTALLAKDDVRRRMARAARDFAARSYSWEVTVSSYLALLLSPPSAGRSNRNRGPMQ